MMAKVSGPLTLAAFGFLLIAPAQADEPEFFDAISKAWVSDCDAWGRQAECRSTWSTGLSADHLIQTYSIRDRESGGVMFEGRGVYRLTDGDVTGFWEDSQGAIHPLHGTLSDQTLSVVWGSPATTLGRSTYRLDETGLTVHDYGLNDGGWTQFMQVHYAASPE